ncbi:MAG TPA: 2-hydroxy-acid oxidase, partial [Afipia sp.]
PPKSDAHAELLRGKLRAIGGHATLLRASEDIRASLDVFHPQAPGVAALSQRVKDSFDPRNILNRGRMVRA